MQLRVDDALEPNTEKRFYLQYAFPPSSVGETGRTGAPGRREVGHGALAEKALRYALPDAKTFPTLCASSRSSRNRVEVRRWRPCVAAASRCWMPACRSRPRSR